MSGWYYTQTVTFRVKTEGKGVQQVAVDLQNPSKSIDELETKAGLKCPEDRRKELLSKLNQPQHIELPNWLQSVTVPEWYTHATSADVTQALSLGCEMVQEQKRISENKLHDQLDLKWRSIVEETRNELIHQLDQKEKDLQETRQAAKDNLSMSGFETKLQTFRQQWVEERDMMFNTMERERQTLRDQIQYLQTQTTQLEESRKSLQLKLEEKSVQESLMNKSAIKGGVGEEMVDGWLRQVFLGAEIEDTSKEDGKMDRQMIWNNVKILIDAKNHEGKLHSIHDVKKFHDNVHANPDAQIAILLCLHTKVPNHNKFWVETEIINENQLVVYMNNVSMNPIERLQLVAGTVIQPWKEYLDLRRKMRELLVGDELKTWADTAKSVLTKGWTNMMRLQDQWTKTHSAVQASMKEFQDMLVQLTQELQTDLRSIEIEAEIAFSTAKKGRSKK